MDIDVIGCPIIREKDGLAKSSRNTYLNKEERKAALILYKTISLGKDLLVSGERDVNTIINKMKDNINKEPLAKIDYVEAVDLETVEKIDVIKGKVLIAMAVYIGKTRLIDNFTFEC